MLNLPVFLISFLVGICSLSSDAQSLHTGYRLSKPDSIFFLPDTLREISGLTTIDSSSFACIQDENGIVFIYDLKKNSIKSQFPFAPNGDYEEIARVGKTIYVLRSDGMLYEIPDYTAKEIRPVRYQTNIPAKDNEGLCYDKDNNRLLIASKSKAAKGPQEKDKRYIYSFDLLTKTMAKVPAYSFNLNQVRQAAIDAKVRLPLKYFKNGKPPVPWLRFQTSAICIHPVTKKLYLLSASDHLLFVTDNKGNIEHIEELSPVLFNKAEGIGFFENGDMLISNEAQLKKPRVLRFNYKKE